jgi:hypothetical protein
MATVIKKDGEVKNKQGNIRNQILFLPYPFSSVENANEVK